jgi:hypothetical protein
VHIASELLNRCGKAIPPEIAIKTYLLSGFHTAVASRSGNPAGSIVERGVIVT